MKGVDMSLEIVRELQEGLPEGFIHVLVGTPDKEGTYLCVVKETDKEGGEKIVQRLIRYTSPPEYCFYTSEGQVVLAYQLDVWDSSDIHAIGKIIEDYP